MMKKDEANYLIDRALAHGQLDSQGNLNFTVKGQTATEMALQICEVAALWGESIATEAALKMASDEIARIELCRKAGPIAAAIVGAIVLIVLVWINAAHADQYGFTSPAYTYDQEYRDCAWPDDGSGRRYRPGYQEDRLRADCAAERERP